jgi:hypothetical protein
LPLKRRANVICDDYKCRKFVDNSCEAYPTMGQDLRNRLGYCPVLNDGPNKPRVKVREEKKRVGQQKSKAQKVK